LSGNTTSPGLTGLNGICPAKRLPKIIFPHFGFAGQIPIPHPGVDILWITSHYPQKYVDKFFKNNAI
jgi:hypothetical protein